MSSQGMQQQKPVTQQYTTKTDQYTSLQLLKKMGNVVLTIVFSNQYAYNTEIWIFTDKKELVFKPGEESVEEGQERDAVTRRYKLTAGQYIVRVETNGQVKDNVVDLPADKLCGIGMTAQSVKQVLAAPSIYSAALLPRGADNFKFGILYESSHEYYTDPAVGISQMNINSLSPDPLNSGMFIFLRYPTSEIYQGIYKSKSYWENFTVTDRTGKTIASFPGSCITDDNSFGWNYRPGSGYIGYTLQAPPGMYFLKYSGKNPRMVPIYVYENWHTQFFMTVAAEPLFGSIRIFLSRHMAFDPNDEYHIYVDQCMSKLLNKDYTLDKALLRNVAQGKFEAPMVGLLGAYIYLYSNETKDDGLFRLIVNNLQNVILRNSSDSPDIWALNLLSYRHFNNTISANEKVFINGTPMLRIAFDAIRNAAVDYPWLVPENSLNDLIAENQVFDSPYNTFIPFTDMNHTYTRLVGAEGPGSLMDAFKATEEFERHAYKKETTFDKAIRKKFAAISSSSEAIGTTASAIVNMVNHNENISVNDVAKNLNLPVNTVSRIVRQLSE